MSDPLKNGEVKDAVAFIQANWQRFRTAAGATYQAHGRGAFLLDLTNYRETLSKTPAEIVYLDLATAASASDRPSAIVMSNEIEEYDPRRQIAFVLWHPDLERARIRVLTETPDGNPRTGPERRWFNAIRTCPKCYSSFHGAGPWSECPQCRHEFMADYHNQKTEMIHVPPIVPDSFSDNGR
jgi:hypothetical protein